MASRECSRRTRFPSVSRSWKGWSLSQRNDSDPHRRGPCRVSLPLWRRLPEFHQEHAGDLEVLLHGLDERLEHYRERVSEVEARWALGKRPFWGVGGLPGGAGTLAALRRTVEDRLGPVACCVTGIVVVAPSEGPRAGRWLEVRRAAAPSVLLLWTKRVLPEVPGGFELAEDGLPPAVHVQAALVGKVPVGRKPLPGERLQGVLFWERVTDVPGSGSLEDGR